MEDGELRRAIERLHAAVIYRRELIRHGLAGAITARTFLSALIEMPIEVPAKDGSMLWVMGDLAMREEMEWRYKQYVASRRSVKE
jgi:hypothetical protein